MKQESMFVSLGAVCLITFGCASSSSNDLESLSIESNQERVAFDPNRGVINVSMQEIYAKRPIFDGVKATISQDEIPTGVMFATCESGPDELAVPLNVSNERFCSTLQAFAYRDDDGDVYNVSANYAWSVADADVAVIHSLPGKAHANVQAPEVMFDVFSTEDQSSEPNTMITACATPKNGVSWPNNQQYCESIAIRAVVNMEGAWCFSGATFASDCDALEVVQDGRVFMIGQNGKGYVNTKFVSFRIGGNLYLADLLTRDILSGFVVDSSTHAFIGTWQAWHIPLS